MAPPAGPVYQVYVDGSWMAGKVGFGFVVLQNGQPVIEAAGPVAPDHAGNARNVAGELVGVGHALRWCAQHKPSLVEVFYDYAGIEAWATGSWKAKQPLTQRYRDFARSLPFRVRWCKVAAHSGDRWNDRADALAKEGANSTQAVLRTPTD